jgi:uncharacterized protein YjbI with pentapeptide repeats
MRFIVSGDDERWFPLRLWLNILLVVAGAMAVPFPLWWWFSDKFTPPLSNSLKIDIVRMILYVIAGIGGVVALVIAYRRQLLGEATNDRDRTKAYGERFAGAADQLSSEYAANRLAGVYSLADLADEWDAGRQTCINVLCAYLRMPYERPGEYEDIENNEERIEFQRRGEEQQVRRTIVNVIGERLRAEPITDKTWHGLNFDLSGAVLDGGDLSEIRITAGLLKLENVVFTDAPFSFENAEFSGGKITLFSANFASRYVDFCGAKFNGATVYWFGAKFTRGLIDFTDSKFTDGTMSFSHARFNGAEITFTNTEFTDGLVGFDDVTFVDGRIDFTGAQFNGAYVDFTESAFHGSELDFRQVGSWKVKPHFENFSDGLPTGLLLPDPEDAA